MKDETDFQQKFSRWANYRLPYTAVWELKFARTDSLPFTALKPHQKLALMKAANQCVSYKIPDVGPDQKPFDGFTICKSPAFVVVKFLKDDPKTFYMISIIEWDHEENTSKRRSLLKSRVKEIGITCYLS